VRVEALQSAADAPKPAGEAANELAAAGAANG
jgi:hypothetical protein